MIPVILPRISGPSCSIGAFVRQAASARREPASVIVVIFMLCLISRNIRRRWRIAKRGGAARGA
jgi:hypothetical protein